jgi:hypothetical protein
MVDQTFIPTHRVVSAASSATQTVTLPIFFNTRTCYGRPPTASSLWTYPYCHASRGSQPLRLPEGNSFSHTSLRTRPHTRLHSTHGQNVACHTGSQGAGSPVQDPSLRYSTPLNPPTVNSPNHGPEPEQNGVRIRAIRERVNAAYCVQLTVFIIRLGGTVANPLSTAPPQAKPAIHPAVGSMHHLAIILFHKQQEAGPSNAREAKAEEGARTGHWKGDTGQAYAPTPCRNNT